MGAEMNAVVEGTIMKSEREHVALAKPVPAAMAWTRDQVDLIKRTVCPNDATDDELQLFMHVAKSSGLDPLRKQIHCTKRGGKLVIIAGIDGLQARATREPDFEGILHGVVCQKDELQYDATAGSVVKHTYNAFAERGPVMGAWATVRRRGLLPFTALVRFAEFNQANNPMWRSMPNVMIDKVARSTALRMAYPEQFSAIYEPAEMDQADPQEAPKPEPARAQAPAPTQAKPAAPDADARCANVGHEWGMDGKCQVCGMPEGAAKPAAAAPKQSQQLRARAVRIWKEATTTQGMNLESFQKWVANVLGKAIPSADWTEAQIELLEVAARHHREPGEEG